MSFKGEEWNWAVVSPLDTSELNEQQIRSFFDWVLPDLEYSDSRGGAPVHLPLAPEPIAIHTGISDARVARAIQEMLRGSKGAQLCVVVLVTATTKDGSVRPLGTYDHYATKEQLKEEEPETAFQCIYYQNIVSKFQYAAKHPNTWYQKRMPQWKIVLNAISSLGWNFGSKVTKRVPMEKRLLEPAVVKEEKEKELDSLVAALSSVRHSDDSD